MKGIFFIELLEMVEKEYGPETTELIVGKLGHGNQGVYQAINNYPYEQFMELLSHLSDQVKLSVSDLNKNFGMYLFSRLVILYRPEFAGNSDIFSFLEKVEYFIQVRIQDYFPHTKLQELNIVREGASSISVSYQSRKELIDLAIGLFMGCQRFFNEELLLNTEYQDRENSIVRFTLSRQKVLI